MSKTRSRPKRVKPVIPEPSRHVVIGSALAAIVILSGILVYDSGVSARWFGAQSAQANSHPPKG
jgi:hypothetical protein